MTMPLLATKLYIPPLRPELVPRPRLVERLNAGLQRKLTLVSAPAGFGKTTLIAEWIHGVEVYRQPESGKGSDRAWQVVWLSLDEGDNDPTLFLRYLTAALRQIDETIGQGAESLLQSLQVPSGRALATQLLNDISALPDPFMLVLDDYQAIRRAEIHEMLAFLIDNQPPQMHTVIATRRDPPLPLARWRARGESMEIRAPDLHFTVEEAGEFLNHRMGLDLPAELVQALEARTEGWITGLQLAALALQRTTSQRDRHDAADFVRQFSGSDRYVVDYLVDEVLKRQPAHMRRFLQQTAILEELSPALCDFVRFGPGGAPSSSGRTAVAQREDSAALLEEIERANLFLTPLDNRREWYRYHQLFAEVLLTTVDEGEAQTLHRRAASWHEAHGRRSSAIRHALAGGDRETFVRLIKVTAPDQLQQGAFVHVLSWLDALPDEMVRSDTELATYKGFVLLWMGETEAAQSYAAAAEASLPAEAPASMRGQLLTLQAHLCPDRGLQLIQYATEALELMDESTPFFYGAALLMLAVGHKMSGHVAEMMETFRRLARLEERRNLFMAATAIAEMAVALNLQGQRRKALDLCQRALEEHTDGRGRPLPSLIVVLLEAAMLAYEANEVTLALQQAGECVTMAQQTGISFIAAQCRCYVEVPGRWALGEEDAAWAALQQARELITEGHPLYLEATLDAGSWEAWLNLKQGNIPAAAGWAATLDFAPGPLAYNMSHVYLMYVRVLLAQDRDREAAEALQRLETWARANGWERVLLSTAILRAVAAQKRDDEASALDYLAEALHLAAAEDYVRAFLDEGAAILELLPRLRTRISGSAPRVFLERLLETLSDERQATRAEAPPPKPSTGVRPSSVLVDSLSERELEVLELLSEGLSTPDIADRLYISAGTAKWHTINIYRKLDVHSRMQAVVRARELGLI